MDVSCTTEQKITPRGKLLFIYLFLFIVISGSVIDAGRVSFFFLYPFPTLHYPCYHHHHRI